ncbi:uncharacterized protein LOC117645102 [Thrips palmi]|uniref:Uncharacterized protein LOC117645102 n=1 Tax=Thrips palmi TaxID=161013 RepID=A0A6P8YTV2_THRPL|nr:uncharacterized protein LOC117645102 [Thrips palmi]
MNNVFCSSDPAWFLELLVSASPSLDELRVWNPGEGHLLAVHGMPRLRRLDLQCTEGDLDEAPPVLPALPHRSSLQWLRVGGLPLATTRSLLLAHGPALEVLWLDMGAVPGGEWPEGCSDLAALLAPCAALARLVFRRYDHDRGACRDQLTVARAALPACTVQCQQCDRVAYEDF